MIPLQRQNLLLRSLSEGDRAYIWPRLERVALHAGHVIVARGEPITFVCFPECGVTSIAEVLANGKRVEVALIGREGMTNSQLLLGCEEASHEASVQVGGGSSLRLSARDLRSLCDHSPAARALLLRYVHTLSTQSSAALASNAMHSVEQRLARWLLMCHDRVEGEELELTHECISRMLGVRRASVTEAIQMLEGELALRNTRSRIVIRDRGRLRKVAGEAYGSAEGQYCKLIAPFGKGGEQRPVLTAPPTVCASGG